MYIILHLDNSALRPFREPNQSAKIYDGKTLLLSLRSRKSKEDQPSHRDSLKTDPQGINATQQETRQRDHSTHQDSYRYLLHTNLHTTCLRYPATSTSSKPWLMEEKSRTWSLWMLRISTMARCLEV
ncbi:hypothetical protein KCV06_g91, partial [Aureobasidium melanogenum]